MQRRYQEIVLPGAAKLAQIFDLELLVSVMSSFCIENGKLTISPDEKKRWDETGAAEFPEFYKVICQLPQVNGLHKKSPPARFNAPFKPDNLLKIQKYIACYDLAWTWRLHK